ncbi:MAG: sugar phosphate isomerase/epimerase [Candidatus Eremiobacteraeota bacterium]|nr:sugar phosphate isomerase/epimerase [Candidatus Eremiobacteraeota bacterium]
MKLGFFTANLPELSLEELACFAGEAGFSAIEVACWPGGDTADRKYAGVCHIDCDLLDEDEAEKIKSLMKENSLEISALGYYPNHLDPDPEKRAFFHEHLKKVMRAANMIGCPLVGTFVGRDPGKNLEENLDDFKKIFTGFLEEAKKLGIRLIIENCPMMFDGYPGTNFAYSPEIWDRMFSAVPDPELGLNYDPSHLFWQGIDYIKAIKEFAPRIYHVHAKDAEFNHDVLGRVGIYGNGWWRYRMPGQGAIDWRELIGTLYESGYDGVISIEHEDPVWEGSTDKIKLGLTLGRRTLANYIA